jgi:hypothetical protein
MAGSELEQIDGAVAGAWIKPTLKGDWGGRVKNLVPQIYEAYARIFHPASDEEGKDVAWEEVARRLGTVAHREMQWHAIVGSWDSTNFTDSRWPGSPPDTCEPPASVVKSLCAILANHTATPERVHFGISTIHSVTSGQWPDATLYEQFAREWAILRGPLSAVDRIEIERTGGMHFISAASGLRSVREPERAEPAPEPERLLSGSSSRT